MGKLPYFQFYPGDWLRDGVSGCSLAAQGLWLRMMIVMHDSPKYGYLVQNGGEPLPDEQIARRCGCSVEDYRALFSELKHAGVPRFAESHLGQTKRHLGQIVFSKRMKDDFMARYRVAVRKRKYRENRNVPPSVTPLSRQCPAVSSYSYSYSGTKGGEKDKPSPVIRASDDDMGKCPHQEIIALYHEVLPSLPKVRVWDNSRKKILRSRWAEDVQRQNLDWWRKFFEYVSGSPWLMGQNEKGWSADLEWLVRPSNFGKIANGRYHRCETKAVSSKTARTILNLQEWIKEREAKK